MKIVQILTKRKRKLFTKIVVKDFKKTDYKKQNIQLQLIENFIEDVTEDLKILLENNEILKVNIKGDLIIILFKLFIIKYDKNKQLYYYDNIEEKKKIK